MKRTYLIFLRIIFFYFGAFAQTGKTDSLLQLLGKSANDTSKVLLYWETGISVIYQNPPGAIPYFKKGMQLAKKLNFIPGIERCYAATSTAYGFIAQYDSQLVYIDTAIYYARKAGNADRLALVYLNRADVLENLQRFSAALQNCDTALSFAERTGNRDRLGRINYIMADIFIAQEQYNSAITSLNRAQVFFEQEHNKQMIGMVYFNRAGIYEETNNPDSSITFYKKAINIGQGINDLSGLSAYTVALANVYVSQKKYSAAEAMAQQSLTYSKQTGNVMQESVVHEILSKIYNAQINYSKAIEEELQSYKILDENNEFARKTKSASTLAELYQSTGNITEAYRYLKISRDLNDSLVKQQFNSETAKLQTTFDVAQKNKEIQLLNKDNELRQQQFEKQRLILIAVVVSALLALVGIWLLMNRNKLRQRNKELELRSKIASDLHDDVGATLSSIRMYSNIVSNQVKESNPQSTVLLEKISSNSKEMIENMSDIVWMIKPGNDDFANIENRMLNFANELCVPAGINFEFSKDNVIENITMPMEQRRDLYLIFKEAINNAVKYSDCHSINTTIIQKNNQLQMRIRDDGSGFKTDIISQGNGLSNMKKRTQANNGIFEIRSAVGEGTEIIILLNL